MSTSPAAKSTVQAKQNDTFASIAIIVCMIVGLIVYIIFGKVGLDAEGHPKPGNFLGCLLYTSPSPRDRTRSRMPSSA